MLYTLLSIIESIVASILFLSITTITAYVLKACILAALLKKNPTEPIKRSWLLLVFVLASSLIADSAWIMKLILNIFPTLDYRLRTLWVRVAWIALIVQYQALALFIESLIDKTQPFNIRQKLFIFISSMFGLSFIGLAIYNFNCFQISDRVAIQPFIQQAFTLYSKFLLMLSTLFYTLMKLRDSSLPKILKQQLKIIIKVLIIPHLALDFIQIFPFNSEMSVARAHAIANISSLLLTFAIFYCARKIIGLRFLNTQPQIQAHQKFSFINNFKDILEQLSHATTVQELGHITQTFFKDGFHVPLRRTLLFMRNMENSNKNTNMAKQEISHIELHAEHIFNAHDDEISAFIAHNKILIRDEIAFSQFYEKNQTITTMHAFMETINADVVIPIYEQQKVIAYIIVERDARAEFYTNIERDEMLVFTSYLGNIIHLLQTRNLELLIHQEKELKEELYNKHLEVGQYKESIRSFLKHSKQKEIGIIFYKNRRFIFGNQPAKELVKININTQEGHPLTKALKQIAHQVEDYKTAQSSMITDSDGEKLMLCGVPNLEQSNVIITIYHPEISDIITKQIDLLKDPSKWDYLLYLETTQSGKLINQLVPGSGEQLLNFKINLLKTALSKKATLLSMPEEDLLPTVELLHHISLRETLHILHLEGPEKNFDTAVKLFGINPLFGLSTATQQPLLKKLDEVGTLFIKNIQCLSLDTQEHLAEFIRYGFYRVFKSDQKIPSNIRIVCSTNQDLQSMTQEGKFSKNLFNELKKTSLSMPSLLTIPEHELHNLAQGFADQALHKNNAFKNLLALTNQEQIKISHQRPISLKEVKEKVQQTLILKSKKNEIYQETQFDPAYEISDPDIIQAARLGKHALRDPKIMALLWNKFKNQNKMATFLGVNRSSINRRCKDYNLF
ncbi:MAG: sigma 54-interacting transcriptional regulator [Candidatus Dependentiae bacterium]|nr:sigma 54-interacting transcriptional regulator [Candidatus Dependentiae bacterium]